MTRAQTNQEIPAARTSAPSYVPPFQLTKGQGAPVAANGGISYMAFERDGDAGTRLATADALRLIATGTGQQVIDMIENAPPGPIQTQWGLGFRSHAECVEYIRANGIVAPEGGVALPLRYSVHEEPSYSIVSSNALWRDPSREADQKVLRKEERDIGRRALYFPQVLRDARRIGEYYPGLSPNSPECMDKLGVALAHCESKCTNFYDAHEVERVFYPEMEKLLLEFFPGATDALVYNHDVFDKDYKGDRTEDQANKNPGVNAQLCLSRAQRPERQQRPCALPRAADEKPAQFRARAALHGKRGRREDVAAFPVDQPREAHGDRAAESVRAVRLAVVCRPALHHQLPHLRRPGRRDDPLHVSPDPRVVLVPATAAQRSVDAEVLRLDHGRLGVALVVPFGVRRPDCAGGRAVPQERRRQVVRVFLTLSQL